MENLRPTTPQEVADTLAFALQFNGRKRVHTADGMMAQITAERLVESLTRSGFVLMRKPAAPAHSSSDFTGKLKE